MLLRLLVFKQLSWEKLVELIIELPSNLMFLALTFSLIYTVKYKDMDGGLSLCGWLILFTIILIIMLPVGNDLWNKKNKSSLFLLLIIFIPLNAFVSYIALKKSTAILNSCEIQKVDNRQTINSKTNAN